MGLKFLPRLILPNPSKYPVHLNMCNYWFGLVWFIFFIHSGTDILRCIRPFMSQDVLKSIYYSYLNSLITYGIIFWGNSSYSSHIFQLQKKAVRIIIGWRPKDSCRELFKHLRILLLQSQYILPILLFIVNNMNLFNVNSEIHIINTRQNSNLHQPQANLTLYRKGLTILALKILIISPPTYKIYLVM
jgi:hypothetical protein